MFKGILSNGFFWNKILLKRFFVFVFVNQQQVKDDQIDVLKTLIVNYESHIKKLNGEMIALKLTPK